MNAWVGVALGVPPPRAGTLATTRLSQAAKNSSAPTAQTVCARAGHRRAGRASGELGLVDDPGLEDVRDLVTQVADGREALVEDDHPEDRHGEDERRGDEPAQQGAAVGHGARGSGWRVPSGCSASAPVAWSCLPPHL